MKKNKQKTWNINNSIDLAKLYVEDNTEIVINSDIKFYKHLKNFFKGFYIPFIIVGDKPIKSDCAYFGKHVNFQNLYVIAGIIKSFGFTRLYYNPKFNNEIILGSSKRNSITQKKYYIDIDLVLSLPFYTDTNNIVDIFEKIFFKPAEKIDIINFGINSGLISDVVVQKENKNLDFEDDDGIIESNSNEDHESSNYNEPYEDFHWGGLSGEEAHTAYWNCD